MTSFTGDSYQRYYLIGIVVFVIIVLILLFIWGASYRSQQEHKDTAPKPQTEVYPIVHVIQGNEEYLDIASRDKEGVIFVSNTKHEYFNNHPNTKLILTYDEATLSRLLERGVVKARHLTIDEVVKCITVGLVPRYPNIFDRYEGDELIEKIIIDREHDQTYTIPTCTTEESCNRQIHNMLLSLSKSE